MYAKLFIVFIILFRVSGMQNTGDPQIYEMSQVQDQQGEG